MSGHVRLSLRFSQIGSLRLHLLFSWLSRSPSLKIRLVKPILRTVSCTPPA
jgi:hypothetical protein